MKTLKVTKTVNSTNGVQFQIKVDGEVVSFNEALEILTNSDDCYISFDNMHARRGDNVKVYIKGCKRINTEMTAKEAVKAISDLVVTIHNQYEKQYPDTVETAEAVFFV